jgi:Flp pilus assembly pilin Flp
VFTFLKFFQQDEDGAVTIDWVVLTAGIVSLAIAAWTSLVDDNTVALVDRAAAEIGAE